eukprot:CAMPEP_0194241278 /NCGR_PEP_ID=MMETSP0158-20130606/7191_1 /TAXON_ID=33649 /ORGANISM="Thalassionema nitzschioides, Strain L26-B" /LENGTH=322 /DNA_ID=CAMNT_0038976135 /DNA_START=93 /DNA_END=1061 /DNA_ORIENTATION=-
MEIYRSRMHQSLKSLSGKVTLSPEIDIIEPTDPTALLLQTSAVRKLSDQIRTAAKANAVWLSGTASEIRTFCEEQEEARGNFPAPLPIIYSGNDQDKWQKLAEYGVCAVMISCKVTTVNDLKSTELKKQSEEALALGLQPIPEIILEASTASTWRDEHFIESLVSDITLIIGQEPACLVLKVEENDDTGGEEETTLPPVPKSLSKQLPILGSISVMAGGNRMGAATKLLKEEGYTGGILRKACLPSPFAKDLDLVGRFWSSCIEDLKSTKSKSFQFLTRNYMDKSMPVEWAKYQKSVIDSGALGNPEDNISINSDNGDYQGF